MAIKEYERATSSYLLLSIRQRNVVDVFFFLRKMSQPIVRIQFVRKVCSKDFQFSHIAPRDMSSLLKISMNFHTKDISQMTMINSMKAPTLKEMCYEICVQSDEISKYCITFKLHFNRNPN